MGAALWKLLQEGTKYKTCHLTDSTSSHTAVWPNSFAFGEIQQWASIGKLIWLVLLETLPMTTTSDRSKQISWRLQFSDA